MNEFVEWEEVYVGAFYGTLKSEIQRRLGQRKARVVRCGCAGRLEVERILWR